MPNKLCDNVKSGVVLFKENSDKETIQTSLYIHIYIYIVYIKYHTTNIPDQSTKFNVSERSLMSVSPYYCHTTLTLMTDT